MRQIHRSKKIPLRLFVYRTSKSIGSTGHLIYDSVVFKRSDFMSKMTITARIHEISFSFSFALTGIRKKINIIIFCADCLTNKGLLWALHFEWESRQVCLSFMCIVNYRLPLSELFLIYINYDNVRLEVYKCDTSSINRGGFPTRILRLHPAFVRRPLVELASRCMVHHCKANLWYSTAEACTQYIRRLPRFWKPAPHWLANRIRRLCPENVPLLHPCQQLTEGLP